MKSLLTRSLLPTAILAGIGMVLALTGLVTLTIASPQTQVQAVMETPSTPYIISREGVFELTTSPITVTAVALENQEITLVVGNAKDIHAWLGNSPYTEVTGLESWDKLQTEIVQGEVEDLPNPAKSDMWVKVLTGTGTVSYTTSADSKTLAFLATVDGKESAPQIALSWTMAASLLWRVGLLGVGLLLALAGGILLWFFKKQQPVLTSEPAETVEKLETTETAESGETVEVVEPAKEPEPVEVVEAVETPDTVPAEEVDEPVHERKHGAVIETVVGTRSIKFPSRQAIKEARLRGESVIEIDGKTFQTGLIPVVQKVKNVAEAELEGE